MNIYRGIKTWSDQAKWTDSAGDSWNIGVDTQIIKGRIVNAIAIWPDGHGDPLKRWVLRDIPLNDLVKDVIAIEETNLKQYMNQRDWETIEPHHGKFHSEDELRQVAEFYWMAYNSQLPVQQTESIFRRLFAKYPKWLKPRIIDVRIVQTELQVWLEITKEDHHRGQMYYADQTIDRIDLAYDINGEPDVLKYSPNDSVSENATKFVETLDPRDRGTTLQLFHREARYQIDRDKKLNPGYELF